MVDMFHLVILVPYDIPLKFLTMSGKRSISEERMEVTIRTFDWKICQRLEAFPRFRKARYLGVPAISKARGQFYVYGGSDEPSCKEKHSC